MTNIEKVQPGVWGANKLPIDCVLNSWDEQLRAIQSRSEDYRLNRFELDIVTLATLKRYHGSSDNLLKTIERRRKA
jgi:hypothetical protein